MKPYQKNGQKYFIYDQKDLDKAYAAHQEYLKDNTKGKKMNLFHVSGKDLDFSGMDLTGAALAHASFQNCNFDKAVLNNVDFSNSNLKGSTIRNTEINHANLYYTKLPETKIENVKISGTNLSHADLSKATWVRNVSMTGGKAYQLRMTEKQSKGLTFDASVQNPPKSYVDVDLKAARKEATKGKTKTAEKTVG